MNWWEIVGLILFRCDTICEWFLPRVCKYLGLSRAFESMWRIKAIYLRHTQQSLWQLLSFYKAALCTIGLAVASGINNNLQPWIKPFKFLLKVSIDRWMSGNSWSRQFWMISPWTVSLNFFELFFRQIVECCEKINGFCFVLAFHKKLPTIQAFEPVFGPFGSTFHQLKVANCFRLTRRPKYFLQLSNGMLLIGGKLHQKLGTLPLLIQVHTSRPDGRLGIKIINQKINVVYCFIGLFLNRQWLGIMGYL